MKKNSNKTIVSVLSSIVVVTIIVLGIIYIFNYTANEGFKTDTTHNVDLPLTTTYSCQNMCGPPGRCAITGTQCIADIDCYGCKPNTSPDLSNTFLEQNKNIVGDDAAGKLSYIAPSYSSLTHDSVYNSKIMISNPYSPTPTYQTGYDTWTDKAADMREIYDFTYQPSEDTPYLSKYPPRYSVTGQFKYTGPFASNATLQAY